MPRAPVHFPAPPSPRRPRRGFSFVELMFAVMILGIGFIMAAAVFPVSIEQAHSAADETVSAAVAWNAFTLIQEKFSSEDLPPALRVYVHGLSYTEGGLVRSFRDPQSNGAATLLKGYDTGRYITDEQTGKQKVVTYAQRPDYLWNQIKGEEVVADDPRYAWVAFYRREIVQTDHGDPASWARVVVVVARAREGSAFTRADVAGKNVANLQPRPVTFKLTSDGKGPIVDQVVQFTGGAVDAAGEGAFLIVADDTLAPNSTLGTSGAMNCQIFRLGNRLAADTWELSPEADFSNVMAVGQVPPGFDAAEGFIVGRATAGDGFQGIAQDVSAYTMILPFP